MTTKREPVQFAGRKQHPVGAHRVVDGWVSTGIAFEDYSRMSTQQHKASGERRLPTPQWSVNDKMLRELLVVFMEERAGFRKQQRGDLHERLARAKVAIIGQRPRLMNIAAKLCAEYVHLKRVGARPDMGDEELNLSLAQPLAFPNMARTYLELKRRRELEIEIEGIDTYLRYTANGGADVVAGIVYLYYRTGLDSVGVGTELGLKPPHVRQTLWRLHDTWKKMVSQGQAICGAATNNAGRAATTAADSSNEELALPPIYAILNLPA